MRTSRGVLLAVVVAALVVVVLVLQARSLKLRERTCPRGTRNDDSNDDVMHSYHIQNVTKIVYSGLDCQDKVYEVDTKTSQFLQDFIVFTQISLSPRARDAHIKHAPSSVLPLPCY